MSVTALLRRLSVVLMWERMPLRSRTASRQKRQCQARASIGTQWWYRNSDTAKPRLNPLNGLRAHDGVPAIVDEVRSAWSRAELFRQSSSESEDASSIADDICEESNEEELKADDVAIKALPPEPALELTHTTFVAVVLRVVQPCEVTTGWKTRAVSSQLDTGVTRCTMGKSLLADCRTNSSDKYHCKPSLRQ